MYIRGLIKTVIKKISVIRLIKKIIKRLHCKHTNAKTITNIYGDAINAYGARSMRHCEECGKVYFSQYLDLNCKRSNNFNFKEYLSSK